LNLAATDPDIDAAATICGFLGQHGHPRSVLAVIPVGGSHAFRPALIAMAAATVRKVMEVAEIERSVFLVPDHHAGHAAVDAESLTRVNAIVASAFLGSRAESVMVMRGSEIAGTLGYRTISGEVSDRTMGVSAETSEHLADIEYFVRTSGPIVKVSRGPRSAADRGDVPSDRLYPAFCGGSASFLYFRERSAAAN
jgi:hypothetical protein